MVDCRIVSLLFPLAKPGRCALSFFEDAHPTDSNLTVEIMEGVRTRDGEDENHLQNMALVQDFDQSDLLFDKEHASLLCYKQR